MKCREYSERSNFVHQLQVICYMWHGNKIHCVIVSKTKINHMTIDNMKYLFGVATDAFSFFLLSSSASMTVVMLAFLPLPSTSNSIVKS